MPNKLLIIQKGESLPFKFDRGGASIEGWTCQIKVKQKPADIPTIDRTITADDDRAFSGFLSRTETLTLIEGLWYLTGILTNEGTDEQEEIPVRFQVTKSWGIQVNEVVSVNGLYENVIVVNSNTVINVFQNGFLIVVDTGSGNIDITLPDLSLLTDDFRIGVVKETGDVNQVNVKRAGANTINGGAGDIVQTAKFKIIDYVGDQSTSKYIASNVINQSKGPAVASATQPNIWGSDGDTLHITGTTQIDDFTDAPRIGAKVTLIFDGILTFKNGLGITLPGGDIITAVGDQAEVYADAVDAFIVTYFRADGTAVVGGGINSIVEDTAPQLGGFLDTNAFSIIESQGANVASVTQPNIWAGDGDTLHITGIATITDFTNAPKIGAKIDLIFDGILILTHGSGITLPGSANITTAPGDRAEVYADALDAFTVTYFRADGTALVGGGGITLKTPQSTTSGTTKDFTGIPAGTKRITVMFNEVSSSGNSGWRIQIGDAGGIESSGYLSTSIDLDSSPAATSDTAGFLMNTQNGGENVSGTMVLTLIDSSTNTWIASSVAKATNVSCLVSAGTKSLSAELTQLRIFNIAGSFDNGQVNIQFQ